MVWRYSVDARDGSREEELWDEWTDGNGLGERDVWSWWCWWAEWLRMLESVEWLLGEGSKMPGMGG